LFVGLSPRSSRAETAKPSRQTAGRKWN